MGVFAFADSRVKGPCLILPDRTIELTPSEPLPNGNYLFCAGNDNFKFSFGPAP